MMRNSLTIVEGFSYHCTEEQPQLAENLVHQLFEFKHFMHRCLKFKKEKKAVKAPYKEKCTRTCRRRQSN